MKSLHHFGSHISYFKLNWSNVDIFIFLIKFYVIHATLKCHDDKVALQSIYYQDSSLRTQKLSRNMAIIWGGSVLFSVLHGISVFAFCGISSFMRSDSLLGRQGRLASLKTHSNYEIINFVGVLLLLQTTL